MGKDPKTGKMAKYETTLAQIVFFKWADEKGSFNVLQEERGSH